MSSLLKVRYASLTDVGVRRSHNQDACAAQPAADEAHWQATGHVFIVADGMGGHAVGEKASAKAVRDIPLTFQKHVRQEGVAAAIRRAFRDANADIYAIGQKTPEFKGMGTTSTGLFLRPDGAWFGHVGDSRAYRIRGNVVEQLTFDHSWVWEIARRQGIDPDELGDFKKNVIIRSLGPDAEVEVDVEGPHPVRPGDVFLLCSDGLSNLVFPDEMGAVVNTLPPDEAVRFLVELANVRGGPDNITCVVVQVPGQAKGFVSPDGGGRPNPLRRAVEAWGRVVPWSYTFLALGSALAALSVVAKLNDWGGVTPLFLLAAVLIVAGVIGLIPHLKRAAAEPATSPGTSAGELHVYKGYKFDLGPTLFDRLAEVEAMLRDALRERESGVDWPAVDALAGEATQKREKDDLPAAFRARCHAVQLLAAVYNKDRNKEEAFQPNWTTPSRAAGG